MSSGLVYQKFTIPEDLLIRLSLKENSEAGYFTQALKFYEKVYDREVTTLSEKQIKWLWELECTLHEIKQKEESSLELPEQALAPNTMPERLSLIKRILRRIRIFLYGAP